MTSEPTTLASDLTHADVRIIMRLVEALHRSGLDLLRIEAQGLQIEIGRDGATFAGSLVAPSRANAVTVASPHVGIFRAGLDAVQPGDAIEAASPLGSIETLDDVTEVTPPTGGTLVEQLVRDGDFVEYGQPLYRILPPAA